ncbi:putative Phosphatidylinositol transfer protein beta [Monocercomonoides exilis]|uniref:putative Phosphatidylinositol transfer protein beta n=1 Tax=Monocercomonoides exilis TaxID=2049356 RepID=UPI0035594FF2|nr:putative Phosphatidylinositol transfer protein beta [Monocercomonoides exilis]|eukprot:MONOS_9209.1-p1 / transcript=MONOS_9209.1 / gene=MONOS_9209 / organism=Monocercomonoides_exilis_PA203 / gene_product=Phosphatidylinositol transfer protein beta isoform / transcript_product=Phosphatidylinositol transfer protein beta isoform / location=Mono_scaffold00371:44973-46687(-) / protein_length=395 / sequence_SO=supercontig / SO=protein_coding / is_pseudo=false
MKIVEYRTQLPIGMDEFLIGQLYMVAKASAQNSGGGDGIEVLKNEPFVKDGVNGIYTFKRMHIASRVPKFLRVILPKNALILEEESWNAFPYTKTMYTNPWLKKDFSLTIESMHIEGAGPVDNALKLTDKELKMRKIEVIDLGDKVKTKSKEYKCSEDCTVFKSAKTGRGPLAPKWWEKAEEKGWPVMTAYKVMKLHFKWFGLQTIVENYAASLCKNVFGNAHRQQFCWIDEYYGMTMDDVRAFEKQQQQAAIKGLSEAPVAPQDDDEEEKTATPQPSATEAPSSATPSEDTTAPAISSEQPSSSATPSANPSEAAPVSTTAPSSASDPADESKTGAISVQKTDTAPEAEASGTLTGDKEHPADLTVKDSTEQSAPSASEANSADKEIHEEKKEE